MFNPFDNFQRDVFGKCEVCFRQGHCSIMECQDQQKNQLNVIDSIVDHSPLRPQNSQAQVVSQNNGGEIKIDVLDINRGISSSIVDSLNAALSVGSTAPVVNQINNMMNNYVLNQNPGVFLHPYSILNVNPSLASPAGSPINVPVGSGLLPAVEQIEKVAHEIEDDISKVHLVQSDVKGNHKANHKANQVLHEEVNTLKRVDNLVGQVEESLNAAKEKIEELLQNAQLTDPNTKVALADSLKQIKSNTDELDHIHEEVDKTIKNTSRK